MNQLYPWQSEIWLRLQGLQARMPNTLLLKGAEGIGKFDLGMNLAQSILCSTPEPSGIACQSCPSCHWFKQGTNPDFRLIQPSALLNADEPVEKEGSKKFSQEISVDQIRELSSFSNLSAHCNGYRIVLIHPAEAMNKNAANALLKSLEEPTDKLLFILISHKPQQLLPTILSRSLSISVPTPSREQSSTWLNQQGVSEAAVVLAQTGFAPLLALKASNEGGGSEERNIIMAAMKQPERFDAIALAEHFQRTSPLSVIHFLQQWCYDLARFKLVGTIRYHPEQADLIKKITASLSLQTLFRYLKELQTAKREALHPLNTKLLFESIFLSYQQMIVNQHKEN